MRNIIYALLLMLLMTLGCDKRSVIDRPIVANNFKDFVTKIDSACADIPKPNCDYIYGLLRLQVPNIDTQKEFTADEQNKIKAMFIRFNQKTPRELVLMYKSDKMEEVQLGMEKDKEIETNLDEILEINKRTAKYQRKFQTKNIKNTFSNSSIKVMWSIFNYSKYNIKTVNGKVQYFDDNNNLIAVSEVFSYIFQPDLLSNERLTLLINIDMEPEIIKKVKSAKNLKTTIILTSMVTDSTSEPSLIFSLPDSYDKMRELLEKSKTLQLESINMINSISTE